jgi:hypothetical protein
VERVLVALAVVALLSNGAEHGRADYLFVCQLPGPSSSAEQFPSSRGSSVDPMGNVFFPNTVNQDTEVLSGSRLLLTHFDNPSRRLAEPSDPALALVKKIIADDWQKFPTLPLTADGIFLGDSANLGIGGLQFRNRFPLDASPPGGFVVADAMDERGETPGDEVHIARFGSLGGDAPSSESSRAALPFTNATVPDKVSERTLILVFLLAFVALGTVGYLWRRRRRRLHRALRGPRRATVYRTPNFPWPPSRGR